MLRNPNSVGPQVTLLALSAASDIVLFMHLTSDDLWNGIDAIGKEDGAEKLPPAVVAKLIELGFVALSAMGLPWLTEKGERAYIVLESGDGEVPELDNYDQ